MALKDWDPESVTAWKPFTIIFTSMSAEGARCQTLRSPVSILRLRDLPLLLFSLSGFDPIFYLHHANVDRLLSLWSALNPGVWVTPGIAEDGVHQGGSFTTPPGAPYDETTGMDHLVNITFRSRCSLIPYYFSIDAVLGYSNHFLGFRCHYGHE